MWRRWLRGDSDGCDWKWVRYSVSHPVRLLMVRLSVSCCSRKVLELHGRPTHLHRGTHSCLQFNFSPSFIWLTSNSFKSIKEVIKTAWSTTTRAQKLGESANADVKTKLVWSETEWVLHQHEQSNLHAVIFIAYTPTKSNYLSHGGWLNPC